MIHPSFGFCEFLEFVNDYHLRRATTRILLSDHPLEIERDRHHRPSIPRDARWCKSCMNAFDFQVGDELHHIDTCAQHSTSRERCISELGSLIIDGPLSLTLKSVGSHGLHSRRRIWRAFARFFTSIIKTIETSLHHSKELYLSHDFLD